MWHQGVRSQLGLPCSDETVVRMTPLTVCIEGPMMTGDTDPCATDGLALGKRHTHAWKRSGELDHCLLSHFPLPPKT